MTMTLNYDDVIAVLQFVLDACVIGCVYLTGYRWGRVDGWNACRDGIEPPPLGTEESP